MPRKFIWLGILIIVIGFGAGAAWAKRLAIKDFYTEWFGPSLPEPIERTNQSNSTNTSVNTNAAVNTNLNTNSSPTPQPLPTEINLKIPFTSQAPHANWDLPYQEACEEAAALMVHYFWADKTFASKEEADAEIRALVDFEERTYGFYKDTTAAETATLITDTWGYRNVEVVTGTAVTVARIKREVADGFPVIIMAAGQQLGNPNFRGDGPLYHALVVKGYTKDGKFITNDPGTRNGADYVYAESVLFNAIHDWNNGDPPNGQKAIIIVRPNS